MTRYRTHTRKYLIASVLLCSTAIQLSAQPDGKPKSPPVPGPMLAQGTITLDTSNMGNGTDQMQNIFGNGGAAKLVIG